MSQNDVNHAAPEPDQSLPPDTQAAEKEKREMEAKIQNAIEGFKDEQNLMAGALIGSVAALAGAAVWATVTVVTEYQIGWMAIGIGFLVGISVRLAGKGMDQVFGIMGAVLALSGCVLGNFFTTVHFISVAEELGFFETLTRINPAAIPELMTITFSPIDLLFYGFAIYEGFKLSFRQITREDLARAISTEADED